MDRSAPSKAKVAAARVCLSALKASETPTALNSGRSERLSPIAMQFEASTPKHSHCCLMNVTLVCSSAYAAVLPINTPSLTASSGPHHASNPNLCARLSETTVQAQDARTGLIPLDLHSATDCAIPCTSGRVQPSVNFTYPMASVSTSINIAYRVISDLTACVSILCISHPVAGTQPVRNKCARANAVCERSVDIKKCNSRHSSLFIYWFSPNLQPVTKPIAYQKAHISEKKGR